MKLRHPLPVKCVCTPAGCCLTVIAAQGGDIRPSSVTTGIALDWLPYAIAAASLVIVVAACCAMLIARLFRRVRQESEKRYRAVVEQASEGIILMDGATRRLLEVNRAFVELTGYPAGQILDMAFCNFIALPPGETEKIFRQILTRKQNYMGEVSCRRKDNSLRYVELRISLIYLDGKEVLCAVLHDISRRRQAEKTLKEAGARFRRAIFCAPIPIMMHTEDGAVCMINNVWSRLTGYSRKEIPTTAAWAKKAFGTGCRAVLERFDSLYTTDVRCMDCELTVTTSSGDKLLWDFRSAPMGSLADGRRLFMIMAIDITERKRAEMQLKASLDEKEVLLKEIHHRVKNNMQVISSLLQMQSRHAGNSETGKILRESRERVRSMALIHEMLYRSPNLSRIDFGEYTRTLVGEIMRTYCLDQGNVTVEIHTDRLEFGPETAIPCGLIINELITNSLKHAFPNGRKGTITIEFKRDGGDGMYSLMVSDDGIGLPRGLDLERTGSLGANLVKILTKQLHGTVEPVETAGAAFRITFREKPVREEGSCDPQGKETDCQG